MTARVLKSTQMWTRMMKSSGWQWDGKHWVYKRVGKTTKTTKQVAALYKIDGITPMPF